MEVIIFIIVLCFLFSSQKKKSQKVGKKETPVPNRPVTDYRPQTQSRPVNSTQSSIQRSNMQSRQAAVRTAGGAAGSMTPGNGSSVSRTVEKKTTVSRQAKSTTEMLEEKARQDAMEHQEEKRRQLAEERRIHGQLRYAERYLPGDMIPKGRRLVCCGYCNAENLIPERDNPKRYNCYFCRETL